MKPMIGSKKSRANKARLGHHPYILERFIIQLMTSSYSPLEL